MYQSVAHTQCESERILVYCTCVETYCWVVWAIGGASTTGSHGNQCGGGGGGGGDGDHFRATGTAW